jgi:hypothetical protein
LGEERRAFCGTGAADNQLDEPAAQARGGRHPCGFAGLGLAANLHDDALAFVQPPAARENLVLRQEGGPAAADVDERRPERRQEPRDSTEMNAPGLTAVAAFDEELDGNARFEQRRAPLARTRGYQELAIQLGR